MNANVKEVLGDMKLLPFEGDEIKMIVEIIVNGAVESGVIDSDEAKKIKNGK